MLFSGKSWDFYKHINKQGRYLVYISQYRRYSTNKMFLHLLWIIYWHCVVYCLHWILEIVIFTVVMQLIRLFVVVNNNLIIDKLLQKTKKRLCFRVHCWHTTESCDSCGTAAQTHANEQSVFFFCFFSPAATRCTSLTVWPEHSHNLPFSRFTDCGNGMIMATLGHSTPKGQGCDGLSTGTY